MSAVRELIRTIFEIAATLLENHTPKPDTRALERMLERPQASQTVQTEPVQTESASATGTVSHIATPPTTSVERYCLECLSKHLTTAKVLAREALQRAEGGEDMELVAEKVRGVYEEMTGAEDDSQAVFDEGMRALNAKIRDARKWIFDSNALIAPSKEKVAELTAKVGELEAEVYKEMRVNYPSLKEGACNCAQPQPRR